MFSIQEELRRLAPIRVDEGSDESVEPTAIGQWDQLTKTLARMGKQQLRTNQNVELALSQTAAALSEAEQNGRALREQGDEYRRELQSCRDAARETRLMALAPIDMLDDLLAMARQKGDVQWIDRTERIIARTLDGLARMGVSEIRVEGSIFDERAHEVVDAVDRGEREPNAVVEVIRRGFRFDGVVLRRVQVVATR